jgi:dihydroorotase
MPNLVPPVCTVPQARAYRERVLAAVAAAEPGTSFVPYMTLYLTEQTTVAMVEEAKASGFILAFKWYPAGATTNADFGVRSIEKLNRVLAAMEAVDLVLCVHGESTDPTIDVFERESHFIQHELQPVRERFPRLRIVLEHVSTAFGVAWVARDTSGRLAATVTPQHLLCNRNDLLVGGLKPHYYCLPILKKETDRQAILEAIRQDERGRFFLGTDSAPHVRARKETSCVSAGCFTALTALELYAEAFSAAGMLPRLERFASINGAMFYGLAPSEEYLELVHWSESIRKIPSSVWIAFTELSDATRDEGVDAKAVSVLQPFRAGSGLAWSVEC